jgi:alkanesulfonate monooxygenase SsuD/methylene tetrahydromethanopterin reductase-like flavin-dependent oxidoreductase (luciferase family)
MPPPLALVLEIDGAGAHPAAWRRAVGNRDELVDPERLRRLAENVENAGFAAVTIADELVTSATGEPAGGGPGGGLGAVERAAFVAAATSVLGVVPVVSTTYAEPFHVSSQLASLDHVSAGRAGWLVATSPAAEVARAWGRPAVAGVAALRREAVDGVEVVRALWDSWEDDAVIRDVASGRYLDRDRLHYADFRGDTYSVRGPAIVPRPPQGQPVVFAPAGLLPAGGADVALVGGGDVAAVRNAAAAAATTRTFVELEVALDTPAGTGAGRLGDLERTAPWPDTGRLRYVGDPAGLVALLAELAEFADGVRLHPLVLEDELVVLSQLVLPALFAARTAARPLPGATLRQGVGLPRPRNRYALPERGSA